MKNTGLASSIILGVLLFSGMIGMGYILSNTAMTIKEYERTVTVKGLSEREYRADIVIWPIQFSVADNDVENLYNALETTTENIADFLDKNGIQGNEISISSPVITDKSAQRYGSGGRAEFRYSAVQTVTVYSADIDTVRTVMQELSRLGKTGVVLTSDNFQSQTEYLFTRLNEVKPEMVEEATRKSREVALKFAADSKSSLGKIKRASQGQFTITPRDKNNPHIKKIRVVSTVEYYLSD